jgi:hypothetical protein
MTDNAIKTAWATGERSVRSFEPVNAHELDPTAFHGTKGRQEHLTKGKLRKSKPFWVSDGADSSIIRTKHSKNCH